MSKASPPEASNVGRILAGRYRLTRLLGTGGMGSVYEAVHVHTDKRVAVKLLSSGLSKDLKLVARFRREAMAASRLEQENCVHVDDFGEDTDGTFFIVMELIEGHGLADELRRTGPMPPARVAHIAVQLLKALDTAHAAGVLHRDLKPQNVMLTDKPGKKDIVKVVDFGIAKITTNSPEDQGALTVPGTIFGTPEYMSPEQARGETLDARSDLYSASVVLWHMLLGRSPFRGASVRETLLKVFSDEAPPLTHLAERPAPAFEAALKKAMAKRKEDRFADAASFIEVLAPFVDAHVHDLPRRARPGLPRDGSPPPATLDDQRSATRPVADALLPPLAGAAADVQLSTLVLPESDLPQPMPAPMPQPMPRKGVPAGTPVDKSTRVVTVDAVMNSGAAAEAAMDAEAVAVTSPARAPAPRVSARAALVLLVVAAGLLVVAAGAVLVARSLARHQTDDALAPVDAAVVVALPPVPLAPVPPSGPPIVDEPARDAALATAEAALARDDVGGALAAYQQAWRADGGSTKAMQGVATTAMRAGDHGLAVTALERLMAVDDKFRRAFTPLYEKERQLVQQGK
ncbi:MAG: serine/threonine protein kinase [Deltaproteobacteria bacterium]|nr:serine/threonine protein kinase [Deltaproteobacteria bacterium]